MAKTLGGILFVFDGIKHDYCTKESIECLKALCDEVILLDAGSQDGSAELLKSFEDERTKVICLPPGEWEKYPGKEKLAHFQNMALSMLSTEWYFCLQADEVIHEDSFPFIREAIEKDNEGYFCSRINLWGNSQHQLNVGRERTPVGTTIIRLAKTKYFSVDDGEGIYCGVAAWDYLDKIRIYHMGFVRNKHIHKDKITFMLVKVFGHNETDKKLEEMTDGFDPWINFSKSDVVPIKEELPIFVQQWAKERDEINQIII